MEESAREVLYETRHHASRPYSPNYPPQHQQLNEGVKGSFLSLLSTRGVGQLKERWSEYRRPRKLRKCTSLFVSPGGKHVAIAAGNRITILRKDNDYQEPCGFFTSGNVGTYLFGTWSESHDILGVADDSNMLYFIKANGEEITRISKRHLKVSSPIIGLILQDDSDTNNSCLCTFKILTSDGSLHDMEISQDPSASISSAHTSNIGSTLKKQFPQNVFCLDYHPEFFLLAVVSSAVSISRISGNSGSCSLSLWKRTGNFNMEPLFSTQFEGLYSKPKGYEGHLTSPKVLISPQGEFIATLDLRGCLAIFKLDERQCSLSEFSFGNLHDSQVANNMSSRGKHFVNDVMDFTWWTDYILALVEISGAITIFDILGGVKVLKDDHVYSMPILERVPQFPGHLFLLESKLSEESHESSDKNAASGLHPIERVTEDDYDPFFISKLHWSLISFSERSVSEMYDILIRKHEYQAALEFATRHGLDKDEVLKSEWLHSGQGINDINTFLSIIKDKDFVLSECVDKVGPTEDATRALLAYGLHLTNQYRFSEAEDDEHSQIWDYRLLRLKLLQFRDRLETFLGINMGRFSVQDYSKFRVISVNEAAVTLAETGKIGALNLLFKRHPYSLTPFMLDILAAIPETVPVQTYGQLLPGHSPPSSIALREKDWVECEKMIAFIDRLPVDHEGRVQIKTEPIVNQCLGNLWPSTFELSRWYKKRARDIDSLSGQLENCLALVDIACRKGICELQQFHEDISYLHQLIYSDVGDEERNFTMSLVAWEELSDYEKYKMMLKGVKEENVVERLRNKAIPFMQKQFHMMTPLSEDEVLDDHTTPNKKADSFVVRWLKETALENKLEICLMVIEEGIKDLPNNDIFTDEVAVVDCALQCIYLCPVTDRWSTMASILSKLPQLRDSDVCIKGLEKRVKIAEGHIEAGRLLAFYQVPKPISFFLESDSDGKGVKQIIRLILSKFIRRQPGQSDSDWASMWHDLKSLHEKAFPFLDLEYMLMEFCRGLLKAGKFSLARNYLKGTGSVALATEKAENIVIQAAREYFFSASSFACSEIWKAKECLNLFPNSRNVRAEADIIDALTVKLPNLGVNILPVQFRKIKDPMEIIKLAITSQPGAYLNVDELIEIAKLLGLRSQDEISVVQEAIAREAAVAGDLQLAFDLCLVLAKKGHGAIWDLCAAMARGPALDNMDINSRKQLLGFALSHCDEESIGELLHAWKDLDLEGQCEALMILTGTTPPKFSAHASPIISFPHHSTQDIGYVRDLSGPIDGLSGDDQELHNIKNLLLGIAKDLPVENETDWDSLLRENGNFFTFAALRLPWLLDLCKNAELGKKLIPGLVPGKAGMQYVNLRMKAVATIVSWLARNGFAPRDDLIASLAKSLIEPPVTEEEDIMGCSFLLNLVDAFHGVDVIEEQVRTREEYHGICSIMNVGMIYSLLHNSGLKCEGPTQRRELLMRKFQEKHRPLSSDELDKIDEAQSTFWREWKLKLEEQKRVTDQSRVLEQIIPGVETARFLSGDVKYIESVVFSFAESVKLGNKCILKDVMQLADTYGLNHTKVLLQYLNSVLVSEVRTIDDIDAEISDFKKEILACATEAIKMISSSIYPAIDGHNKQRLAYVYGLLSDCYLHLEETKESSPMIHPDQKKITSLPLSFFYKVLEQECSRVSFIKDLNFKNIAGLGGLNFECFSTEVYAHVHEVNVEALAKMVQTLVGIPTDAMPNRLISWQDVYRHYVLGLLSILESESKAEMHFETPENLQGLISELEQTYDVCRSYIIVMAYPDVVDIMKRFFKVIAPLSNCFENLSSDSSWEDCLIVLLKFWLRLTDDMRELASHEGSEKEYNPEGLMRCLRVFVRLIMEGRVSPSQGWETVVGYINCGFDSCIAVDISVFCRAMVFSDFVFGAIEEVFSEAVLEFPACSTLITDRESYSDKVQDLRHFYTSILETILHDMATGSFERQNLYRLLSSLSKIDGDLEDLKRVRHAVWERMAKFSDNLQLPSHVRVYVLELMQFVAAGGTTLKGFSAELQSNVRPWEGWDHFRSITLNADTIADHRVPNQTDGSSRFQTTLVALKSTQLGAAISPSIEITTEDISTVDSAVSCFLKLCGAATCKPHFDALLAILREWEGHFTVRTVVGEANSAKASDAGNDWNTDDWDEGWESFQEEHVEKDMKTDHPLSVHPLHACWIEIFKKLITLSLFSDLLRLIDQSLAKSTGVLLSEDESGSLSELVLGIDCFLALKIVMLFPYEAIQLQCLEAVENKLKQGGMSDTIGRDEELLVLVLSSGLVSTIITKSSYGTTSSYLCYMIGNFSRQCQEAQLLSLKQRGKNGHENNEKDYSALFRRIFFPCFVSELVKADQHILAGFLVTKFMHTNASLSLINTAEASLRKYLESQVQALQYEEFTADDVHCFEQLGNTISNLRSRLRILIQSALSSLPTGVR